MPKNKSILLYILSCQLFLIVPGLDQFGRQVVLPSRNNELLFIYWTLSQLQMGGLPSIVDTTYFYVFFFPVFIFFFLAISSLEAAPYWWSRQNGEPCFCAILIFIRPWPKKIHSFVEIAEGILVVLLFFVLDSETTF